MRTIRIPAEVQYIKYKAFYGCSALRRVIFEGKPPQIEPTAFGMCRSLHDPRFWKVKKVTKYDPKSRRFIW